MIKKLRKIVSASTEMDVSGPTLLLVVFGVLGPSCVVRHAPCSSSKGGALLNSAWGARHSYNGLSARKILSHGFDASGMPAIRLWYSTRYFGIPSRYRCPLCNRIARLACACACARSNLIGLVRLHLTRTEQPARSRYHAGTTLL